LESLRDRVTYRRYLQAETEFDYQFLEAETLEEGIELWHAQSPQLVLVDINLSDGSGLELIDVIKKSYCDSFLPVIAITGAGDERIAVEAMKLGARDYLVKNDITQFALCCSVSNIIKQSTASRKLVRLEQQEAIISQVSLHIHEKLDLNSIYQRAVVDVREFLTADRVVIYKFNPNMSAVIVAESVISPWDACLNIQVVDTCFQKNMGGAYQQGKIFFAPDIYAANLTDCHLQLLEQFQVRANLVVPILLPDQVNQPPRLWGLLIAHQCSGPRFWEESDLDLLKRLSVQLAIALQQAELYQSVQNANQFLEQKVEERTAELQALLEQYRAAEASLKFQARILDEIHDSVISTNPEGIIQTWNQGAEKYFGYRAEEVIGQNVAILYEDPSALQHDVILPLLANKGYETEVITISKSGDRRYMSLRLSSVLDETGNIIRLLGCCNDITERKNAEQVLQELNQELENRVEQRTTELKESEQRFSSLAAAAPVGIFRINRDNECIYVNEFWTEITGKESDSGLGSGWLKTIHPDDQAQIHQQWAQAIAQQVPYQGEGRCIRPDGTIIFYYCQALPEMDKNGNFIGYIGTLTNITERKQAEAGLQQKNIELEKLVQLREEALTLREDMSNMIVHDLRNPLSAMLLSAEIIKKYGDRAEAKPVLLKKAEQILTSGKQLRNMIDSLLLMAKLESGKILFNLEPTDLYDLGTEIVTNFKVIADSHNIKIKSQLPNPGNDILIDSTILRRIIENLLSNSLKFSPSNSEIILSMEYLPQKHIRVTVADSGPGISLEKRGTIFEKFEIGTLKPNVSQIGLGLAFCKMAVKAQGGTLTLSDNHPQGSIFILEI
jgi:PAS domain S-box-containing protein